jgi:hypothetical protein
MVQGARNRPKTMLQATIRVEQTPQRASDADATDQLRSGDQPVVKSAAASLR